MNQDDVFFWISCGLVCHALCGATIWLLSWPRKLLSPGRPSPAGAKTAPTLGNGGASVGAVRTSATAGVGRATHGSPVE